jgi:hypothetical protein
MKKWILAAGILALSTAAHGQYYVYGSGSNSSSHARSGYTTQSGTYVAPSHATNPNNTQMDNYTTRGNVNPYRGAVGTRSPRY